MQETVYALAIDIGASSGRHILGWVENGVIKTQEVYRFFNGIDKGENGLTWNTERLFSEIITGLKLVEKTGKIPSTVGIDTWAVDYALLDEKDNLLGEVFAYRSDRTEKVIQKVHRLIPFETLYERTGIQFQPFNTVYQLYADKESGKLDRAKTFLMLPDYLNFLLTGVKRQEYTNATSTGMVNAVTGEWDSLITSALGYPQGLFKKPSKPGSTVGSFKKEIADAVGFNANVTLPPTHDTASAVECLDIPEGVPYISSGTWSLLGVKVNSALTDEKSRLANWSNEGGVGYFRYQKNVMGLWPVQQLRLEICPELTFGEIAKQTTFSEFDGVVDLDDKRFYSPASMKAQFDLATKEQGKTCSTVADYFKCAYVSLAAAYKRAIDELSANLNKRFDRIYIVGGGAKNDYLNKLTEDACSVKVIALPIEATALGNLKTQLGVCKTY